jgi:AcrR family transcriptional regulator
MFPLPRSEQANEQIRKETTDKILEAAKEVFATKGRAATMADIAAKAEISQGLAYHYFSSKEEIFNILLKKALEADGGPAARIEKIRGTPGTRLALLISYILEDRRRNPGFSQLLWQVISDESAPDELRQLVMRNGKVIQDIMRQLIVEGQACGEIAMDDPDQLMVALLACFDGLMKRANMLDADAGKKNFPDAKIILRMLESRSLEGKRMNRKGICYDVGRVMMGNSWRPKFDPRIVHRELEIIKSDLHCNAVRICGLDIERLKIASEDALKQGLEVWFSPEMWDRPPEETLQYIADAASAAETLRLRFPGKVKFSVGSEMTLFMQGIVEGDNFFQRMNNPSFWGNIKAGKHNKPLNEFLSKANDLVREAFQGEVTYFSVPLETVDWRPFDFAGVDFYRDSRIRDVYGKMVKAYNAYGKPVVVGELGCCTYRGADMLGGNGFIITIGMMADLLNLSGVLPKGITDAISIIPKVDGHFIRDEQLQAREVTEQLAALDTAGVEGAFVFTFVAPTSTYNEDPRFDSDMGSYSLVKSFPEKDTVDEIISQTIKQAKQLLGIDIAAEILAKFTGDIGRHGNTYPDMTWEPKESFKAVADYYNKH